MPQDSGFDLGGLFPAIAAIAGSALFPGAAPALLPWGLGGTWGEIERRRGQGELEGYRPGTTSMGERLEGQAGRGGMPGGTFGEAYFGERFRGARERFAEEEALEQEYGQAREDYLAEFLGQGRALRGQAEDVRGQRETGMEELDQGRAIAAEYLAQGERQARVNLERNLGEVRSQVNQFQAQADAIMGEMRGLRGEALEAASDQSAALLNNLSTGIQGRLNAELAEIEGRQDIPPAARESMKARARFLNSQQLYDTAAHTMATEAARIDGVRAEHDGMIANVSSNIAGAQASIRGAAAGAITGAFATATEAEAALAQAGSEMSQMYSDMGRNYRATMTQQLSVMQGQVSAFQMAGRMDLANMVLQQPRAYLDLSDIYGEMFSTAWNMGQADFNQELSLHNAMMAEFGLLQGTYYQPSMAAWQVGGQVYAAGQAPQPDQGFDWGSTLAGGGMAAAGVLTGNPMLAGGGASMAAGGIPNA